MNDSFVGDKLEHTTVRHFQTSRIFNVECPWARNVELSCTVRRAFSGECRRTRGGSRDALSLARAEAGITTIGSVSIETLCPIQLTLSAVQQLRSLVSAHHGDRVRFVILVESTAVSQMTRSPSASCRYGQTGTDVGVVHGQSVVLT